MGTVVSKEQARKITHAALFTAASRNHSFTNMLTGPAPKKAKGQKPGKVQTDRHAPVVRITDLEKEAGDSVTVDIIHKIRKKPTMGDKKLEGRGENMTTASFDLSINQGRHMVDAGGRMTQKRTPHNLIQTSRTLLGSYYNDLEDEITLAHLAGARGDYMSNDTILPAAADPEFDEIVVNPITPPTYDRHFFGGDATSLDTLDSADKFTLDAVDSLALALDEMAAPMQPIKLSGDEMANEAPLFVLNVTPRQWYDFNQSTTGKDWQTMVTNAVQRSQGFNHPLFRGEKAMWKNILIRKMWRPVRFNPGSAVSVCTNSNNAATTQVQPGVHVERGILLGGQALANAFGRSGDKKVGHHFSMHMEKVDHGNSTEVSINWMNGKAKVRFKDKSGRINDHGVMVLDTAVTATNL